MEDKQNQFEYQLELEHIVNESLRELDEDQLHHFLSYGFVFFLGWLISILFL